MDGEPIDECAEYGTNCSWVTQHSHDIKMTLIGLGILLTLFIIWRVVVWYRRPKCAVCKRFRTKWTDDNNQPICYECHIEHERAKEAKLDCPICGTEMEKHFAENDIVIDVCPKDGSVFLGPGELAAIRNRLESDGDTRALTYLAIGAAT